MRRHSRLIDGKMSALGLAVLTILAPAGALAQADEGPDLALPPEVEAFLARRQDCEHFRGEASGDAARAAELERLTQAACLGSDAELARLQRDYGRDPAVRLRLDEFDPDIER